MNAGKVLLMIIVCLLFFFSVKYILDNADQIYGISENDIVQQELLELSEMHNEAIEKIIKLDSIQFERLKRVELKIQQMESLLTK